MSQILTTHTLTVGGWAQFQARVEERSEHHVTLKVYAADSWTADEDRQANWSEFDIATVYLKWDGCGHVGMRDPDLGKEWVHVCGGDDMERHLVMLQWAWNLARSLIEKFSPDVGGDAVDVVKEPSA